MTWYPDLRAAPAHVAIVVLLAALYAWSSGWTTSITQAWMARVSISPATTWTAWPNYVVAAFFHRNPAHLLYNLVVFSVAFPLATRGHSVPGTLGWMLLIGPTVVFLVHVLWIRVMAARGMGSAVAAMDVGLVGFSVMAYAMAGMALAKTSWGLYAVAGAVGLELLAGLVMHATGPYIWLYHVLGLGAGFVLRRYS